MCVCMCVCVCVCARTYGFSIQYIVMCCKGTSRWQRSDGHMASISQVTILRGKEGYGFTICSDSPVRVQAVDPGGPADQAGLQQLDTVLQLNGQPVEQWKCVDLAHAIRNSQNEITVVVWRTGPVAKPNFEGLIHRPSYKPSCYDPPSPPTRRRDNTPPVPPLPAQHRQGRRGLLNGCEVGGNAGRPWGERRDEANSKSQTQTLKGTTGDKNYIILAPINPGSQILRPVYQDNHATLGRMYHTRPAGSVQQGGGGVGGLQGRTSFLRRSHNSKASKVLPPTGYPQNLNYANYQNCTIVRSHSPHANYSTYVKLAPKILIFPIFVQPLDLCNPTRTLIVSEEIILHENKHLSIKVTVFIYTDLMLVTREDEPGRCNVLQNPLFLQHLRLQDEPNEGLRFYVIHMTEKRDCLLSLEAYSLEQKRRLFQCLRENIEKQLHLQLQRRDGPAHGNQMLEPKVDEQCDRGVHHITTGEEEPPCSPTEPLLMGSPPPEVLTPMEEGCTPLEEELKIPPTPPPSTEGEDCKSMEGEPESWKEKEAEEEEEEEVEVKEGEKEEEERQQTDEDNGSEAAEDTGAPPSSSSSSFVIPELRLDRSFSADALSSPATDEDYEEDDDDDDEEEEEEEEEYEEEDSDDNYLERSESKRRSMAGMAAAACERHRGGLRVQNSLRRRTHSEGSLLQEPRPPCFTSDNAIHRLDTGDAPKAGWTLPSPRTLKKELTKNGGSMHQLCMLFSGRKLSGGSECSCDIGPEDTKKKSKNLAKDMKNRLAFLRRKSESPGSSPAGRLDKAMKFVKPAPEEALKWGESLDKLLVHKYGLAAFRAFLRTEFSEENLEFWLACEDYKKIKSQSKMASKAKKIFAEYIAIQSCKEVNLDSYTREHTKENPAGHLTVLLRPGTKAHLWTYGERLVPPDSCPL
ncbi:hypothetical protein SKAU_G00282100 [Synaphobranchus kaupii]|uniref:Regulator of G-protein signaling 3 n=1 Tax=Synaphobranchus kaupii TaxID=118154 RepID=A0A9Q1IN45_SYNKA|nr:hypothetical protein SKAU_G00282100 [Synaphobranchus kaupii]